MMVDEQPLSSRAKVFTRLPFASITIWTRFNTASGRDVVTVRASAMMVLALTKVVD